MGRDGAFFRFLARGLWVVGFTVLGLVLGAVVLFISDPLYEAKAVLVPSTNVPRTNQLNQGGLAGILGSGIGAGLGLSGRNVAAPFDQYVYLLRSRAVATRLFLDRPLVRAIFATEWDPETQQWHRPHTVISLAGSIVRRIFGRPAYLPPSPERLEDYLRDKVSVLQTDPPFTVVSYRDADPRIARALLEPLIRETTAEYRQGVIEESQAQITHILERLPAVKVAEQRNALATLLSNEEFNLMLVDSKVPIAAEMIDPVAVSDGPVSPRISLTFALAGLLGAVIGLALQLAAPHIRLGRRGLVTANPIGHSTRNMPAE
jgi:hypothetical protein